MVLLDDSLAALTRLILDALDSGRPDCFVVVCGVARTAQHLVRATSVRVEDFNDTRRPNKITVRSRSSDDIEVAVPPDLPSVTTQALLGIKQVIIASLLSNSRTRFGEAERLGAVAQLLVQAVTAKDAPDKGKPVKVCRTEDFGEYGDDEAYMPAQQQRRDYMETQADSTKSYVASAEASELQSLWALRDRFVAETLSDMEAELLESVNERIHFLKRRMRERNASYATKELKNGVVHPDLPRGHQPDGEDARRDAAADAPADAQREASAGGDTQPSVGHQVGIQPMVHA
jgi:hypothetical protein